MRCLVREKTPKINKTKFWISKGRTGVELYEPSLKKSWHIKEGGKMTIDVLTAPSPELESEVITAEEATPDELNAEELESEGSAIEVAEIENQEGWGPVASLPP